MVQMKDVLTDRALRRKLAAGVAAFVAVMALVAGAYALARSERQFARDQWERRLQVHLAEPLAKVSAWLGESKHALAEVAANDTIKIYLSELQAAHYDRKALPQAETQAAYVASYIASAGRSGPFAPLEPSPPAGRLAPMARSGLALFDGRRDLIASTPRYRPATALLGFFLRERRRGHRGPMVLVLGGRPTLVFFRPVGAPHSGTASGPAGYLIGARELNGAMGEALQSALRADAGRIVLIARDGGRVRYLAASDPRGLPAATQEVSLAGLGGDLVAARSPGRLVEGRDLSGHAALLLAEPVDGAPLVLVASVPRTVALAGVSQREHALLTALLLALVAIVAVAIAFNRHLTGTVAAERAAIAEDALAAQARREKLLKAVVNAHPGALILTRDTDTVALVSARFAGELGTDADSLTGKPIAAVLPEAWRRTVLGLLARRGEAPSLRAEFRDGQEHAFSALVVFLPEMIAAPGAALVLVEDVTDRTRAREQRTQLYRGIVSILLEAIDRRDPAAAAHSRRTGALARQVAQRLGVSEADVETAELAGSVQGVAKLFVPGALLRKEGRLDGDERRVIEDAAERWLHLLDQISTDYPVATVSRLAHELGYARREGGTDARLLRLAFIVAAANAFVALTSPRSWRPARSDAEALDALQEAVPQLPQEVREALGQAAMTPVDTL